MNALESVEHARAALAAHSRWARAGLVVLAPPKRACLTALLVALLHALLLLSIKGVAVDRPTSTERLPALRARLIVPSPTAPLERRDDRMQTGAPDRRVRDDQASSRTTMRRSVPANEATATWATQPDALRMSPSTEGAPEPSTAEPPLDLSLKPGTSDAVRSRNPAMTDVDPTHRSTADRIGSALVGDSATSIEELGEGRVRVRRGSTCYEMARSRISELDPFAQRPAWQTETCRR